MRDLILGSAPTDILTLLLSFTALSFGFGYAKDKDERISIMLKSGIPLIGGQLFIPQQGLFQEVNPLHLVYYQALY